ncbi:MAG: VIT domain-containing protein [Polyangiales bacterium]
MKALSKIGVLMALSGAASVSVGCGARTSVGDRLAARLQDTSATVEVMHAGVIVRDKSGDELVPRVVARIERDGSVRTIGAGRAVVRTDDGLELRMAGDSELRGRDAVLSLEKGRVFVSSWGSDERTIRVGNDLTIAIADAALELERDPDGTVRVIGVRGEVGYRTARSNGRLAQGQMLSGRGEPELVPAAVWEDWTGGAASPQGVATRGAIGAGVAVTHGEGGEAPVALATNEHKVTVHVDGDSARTEVAQTFFNGSDQSAAVEYRIRVPEGAMVSSFSYTQLVRGSPLGTVRFGPATVSGFGGEGAGRQALLRAPDGSLFARLPTISPGQSVRVELEYTEWLHREGGRRLYTYPLGDAQRPPFVGEFLFELRVERGGVGAIRGPAGSQQQGSERLRITKSDFRPRGDVVVELFDAKSPGNEANARVWRSRTAIQEQQFAMVDVSLPAPEARGTDLVLVVDDSAATDPGMLTTASAAVNAVIQALGPDDRVMLMFGDLRARPAEGVAGQLGAVDDARRRAILEAISRVRPAGATDMGRILSDAYEKLDARRNGAVVYLGDSMPTMGTLDPARLVDETLRVAPDLRLYVVALGANAHPEVLSRLASRGGTTMRATDQAEAVLAAHRVVAHATRPVLRDVSVDVGGAISTVLPASIEQWVVGDPLRVFGPLTDDAPRVVKVRARDGGATREWTITPTVQSISDGGDLRRRWASARLNALDNQGASLAALADLGSRYGLITSTSALVAYGAPATGEGVMVASSAWPDPGLRTRLPTLGVGDSLEPRGIRTLFAADDYPSFTDDESGWQPHSEDEGTDGSEMLSELLGLAEPEARACVDRARAARPGLSGGVAIAAKIDAEGLVKDVRIEYSSLGDAGAEACIRRVVGSLRVPKPVLFDARAGDVRYNYSFAPAWERPRGAGCPATSRLDREAKLVLWRERLANAPDPVNLWSTAFGRCELRLWEDRSAMIDLLVRHSGDASQLGALRTQLPSDAAAYLDRAVSRRWGPSTVWRAYLAGRGHINWGSLVRFLAKPTETIERKIEVTQAYVRVAPYDIDARLKLLSLYEQANRRDEARHLGELLRKDSWADSRVRAIVGETLIRMGDRDEGLRVFSEIAEHAPYDTTARGRLGDLLLTYGGNEYAEEAYRQFRTLVALRPGDALPRVRMGLAALAAGREDEALRVFRAASEDARGDESAQSIEALIVLEVNRLANARPADSAVQSWLRVAQLFDLSRQGGVVVRWTHPDAGVELRAMPAGDSEFAEVGERSSLKVRVFSPGSALEGSRLILRAPRGVAGRRSITAKLWLVVAGESRPTLVERSVTLDASHRLLQFIVRNGQIVDDATLLPASEVLPPDGSMY